MRDVITRNRNVGHVTQEEDGESDSMRLNGVCSSPSAKSSCVYLCTTATRVDREDVDPELLWRSSPHGDVKIASKTRQQKFGKC